MQMDQVKDIRMLENLVQAKKKEHQSRIQEIARERYENQIKSHDDTRQRVEDEISKLELRERELINRVKQTHNHHQMCVDDLGRILKNEEPLNLNIDDNSRAKTSRK